MGGRAIRQIQWQESTMGIFDKIMSTIFVAANASGMPTPSAGGSAAGGTAPTGGAAPAGIPPPDMAMAAAAAGVDVAGNLDALANASKEKFEWRKSIVDLMKLLKLDSSLASRKELATELGYTGNTSDSATMNVWLHKQVMTKLAANGGRVPDELK
jgi:hypothetical protein